jgi:glutamate-1-semialdehyde 2,1-aminomutase
MANMNRARSNELFAEALSLLPGGVNSPVRAFRAVGGTPFFAERAAGSRVWDVDGNEYIDYVGSWGPAIHGHAYPPVIRAVQEAAAKGTSFGIPNPLEVDLARQSVNACPRSRSFGSPVRGPRHACRRSGSPAERRGAISW